MSRLSRRVHFSNAKGHSLAAIIDAPREQPVGARFLFSHCFTCGKDLKAIVRISRYLTEFGCAVMRFDFTGIGNSAGRFQDSTFVDNCDDLRAAMGYMNAESISPQFMIGHSLGGAAVMSVAGEFEQLQGLITIASPSDTHHLATYLAATNPEIVEQGKAVVTIGGRDFIITQRMLDALSDTDLESRIRQLQRPHLIFHSPADETLKFVHAERLLEWTGGPASLINMEGADHLLLNRAADVKFVARLIADWSQRVLSLNQDK